MLILLILKLANSSRKIFCDRKDGVEFCDDQQFFDLIAYAADGSVTTVLAAFGKDVHKNI